MTPDERISAYIDNELTSDQEQEFLISLAASNGLRKAFRSELVLKNVLHRDESVTNPPRGLRTAVFASLGLGAATALADRADAAEASSSTSSTPAPMHSLVKTLFATKINAFITAATLSISALVGYGVHSLTSAPQAEPVPSHVVRTLAPTQNIAPQVTATPNVEQTAPVMSVVKEMPVKHSLAARAHKAIAHHSQVVSTQAAQTSDSEAKGTVGAGSVTMHEPVVQPNKK